MTARARRLLDALADGPRTRAQIFASAGYLMSNNGAAELRAEGYTVVCSRAGREYVYELALDDRGLATPPRVAPIVEHELVGSVTGEQVGCVRGDSAPADRLPANPGAPEQLVLVAA